jgi:hypothetical protein
MGKVCHLNGDFEESNKYFEYADFKMESFRTFGDVVVSNLVNPSLQSYQAEAHEVIMIHYYKALNYMQMNDIEEALVEARKLNLVQLSMNTAAKGKETKYSQDPFGLILMGLLYEADHDFNNAFIAYRNAKDVYDSDQSGVFHNNAPKHLEQDIVRTANMAGVNYSSALKFESNTSNNGELILFWENGLSPVKNEQNIFFSLDQNKDGYFYSGGGLTIPIDYDFKANDPDFKPSSLGLIRIARSYYVNRTPKTQAINLKVNDKAVEMEMGQNISALAFQIEKDNYLKDLGADLLRLSLKRMTELAVSEGNKTAGSLLSIGNIVSEKSDTRNWQSLPSEIQFARIPLEKGTNYINIKTSGGKTIDFEVEGSGRMVFRNVITY